MKMNKVFRIIVALVITLIVGYFSYFLYEFFINSHLPSKQKYKEYIWIFKDSVKSEIDSNSCISLVKKRDVYNNFRYKGTYNIIIWEFKDQNITDLNEVVFTQNANLYNIKFRSGQVLNKGSDLEISIKSGFAFNDTIKVILDEYSQIERKVNGSNYKGFYGFVNNMSLSDEQDRHQIIFDYTGGKTRTVFLIYKGHNSFFLIMINTINPEMQFDESIIDILNLD
jgi:hypothetical protein